MYFIGIDIGSTAIKIAMINEQKKLVDFSVSPSGSMFHKYALVQYEALCKKNNIDPKEVKRIITTGYGRKLFKTSNDQINEITANALGLQNEDLKALNIRTIINIGGQDSKVLEINDNGGVQDFVMNDKCAAGTGKFLDMAARTLEIGVDELEKLHFEAGYSAAEINSSCAVFAESEIISLLAEGTSKSEIVAGIHNSIAKRIRRLSRKIHFQAPVLFDGGTALNNGLKQALEEEFMTEIIVSKNPEITSAFGAAIFAVNSYQPE